MARIELRNASLVFKVWENRGLTFKEFFITQVLRRTAKKFTSEVKALDDVSFIVEEGERLGVVGHNGAGKSTLLRLLAGIYIPTDGQRIIEGRVSSMLELGVGIEPDANGWDNIAYRAYLQGQTPKEVRAKSQAIADFSDLGDFMNMPVRYYSSGMMVRLVFSIATEIQPEVLVIDEIFAAGDLSFQEKARQRMLHVIDKASILVMASHDLVTMRELCDRVIWLDHGRIRMSGDPEEVTGEYREHMMQQQQQSAAAAAAA